VTSGADRTGDPAPLDEAALEGSTLSAVQVALPPVSEPGGLSLATRLAASTRCRALRICPAGHGYPLLGWVLSPLPELCAREHIALLLDFGDEATPWRDVVELARAFPALPLVALGGLLDGDRTVPAVLDATANVVVELSRARDAGGVAELAGRFGAHRFVWGSGGSREALQQRAELMHGLDEAARESVLNHNAVALGDGTYAARYL
jgi:hypothetical protein